MSDDQVCKCGAKEDLRLCDDCNTFMCLACFKQHRTNTLAVDKDGKPVVVSLMEAFQWDCPKCGHNNVVKMIVSNVAEAPLDDKQEARLKKDLGLEPWESLESVEDEGSVVHVPETVRCRHCEVVFETEFTAADTSALDLDADDDDDQDELF